MAEIFNFKPIYGFGWRSDSVSVEVPEPFVVESESSASSAITGKIKNGHIFSGRRVSLSLRSSEEGREHYNVVIHSESNDEEVTGFGEMVP